MRHAKWTVLFLLLILAPAAAGQGRLLIPPASLKPVVTSTEIQSKIDALDAAPDLDESTRTEIRQTLTKALDQAKRAESLSEEVRKYREATTAATAQLAAIRNEVATQTEKPKIEIPADASLQQVEQSLTQATSDLASARQSLAELQTEEGRRLERRAAIPELLSALRKRLTDLQAESVVQARDDESPTSLEARRQLRQATEMALQREIGSLEAELTSYDARRDLLPARRDQAKRRVSTLEAEVEALQNAAKQRREAEAQKAAQDARRQSIEAARQHPVLQAYAQETADRASQRVSDQGEATQIDKATSEVSEVNAEISQWRSRFASLQRRLDAAGLNRATGLQLRKQYDDLPEESELRRRVRRSQESLEDAEFRLIELQEERAVTGEVDNVVDNLLLEIPPEEMPADAAQVESIARELVIARRDLLDSLVADTSSYFDAAVDLNGALHEKLTLTGRYRSFIEERIFWVRSIAGDRLLRVDDVRSATAWLLSPSAWLDSLESLATHARRSWVSLSGVALLIALVWLPQVRVRRRIVHLGGLVSRYNTDAYTHTVEAFLWTFIRALPIPVTLWAIGWVLGRPIDQTRVAQAIGAGLRDGAYLLYPLMFLRQTLRSRGLAEAHFRWSALAISTLRFHLHWLMPVATTAQVLVSAFEFENQDAYNASLGRISFTVGLVALAAFLRRVLKPHGVVLKRFVEDNASGILVRLRLVWYPLAFLLPIAFAVLSWAGFHYTAVQLESKLEQSLILAMVLIILNGVMLRWLFIARRRVAVEDARRKREQAAADAESEQDSGSEPLAEAPPLDEDKVDLPALSQQTRQLFRAASTVTVVLGLYLIWAQALPALRMLDRVQLLPEIRITDGETSAINEISKPTSTDNDSSSESNGSSDLISGMAPGLSQGDSSGSDIDIVPEVSITLADLGLALVVLIATWASFRNVPGLVEIVVLQRLPLDSGSRYALSTVMRYLIAIIGVLAAAATMGLAWSNVQWLAAALTFGLAFGLQEIFANFVSGLIILAERPVRMGDTVTVSNVTGTVTRIRMRATTITDWERKELIIPNKTFITSDVINWTLSDTTLRITIPVGVSYEADIEKVEKLLYKIAAKNKVVLEDPKPQVLFKSFGDSTLDYELRVYIPSIEHLVSIRHEMHTTIIKEFRKAGIEIAFPQRDLHVRSIEGLEAFMPKKSEKPEKQGPAEE